MSNNIINKVDSFIEKLKSKGMYLNVERYSDKYVVFYMEKGVKKEKEFFIED